MKFKYLSLFFVTLLTFNNAQAADESIQGLYKAVLQHEGTKFYQHANITLRSVNTGGSALKISANVKVYFGDPAISNEFLTYEFDDCPMNLLTRQISIRNEKNNIALIGFLRNGGFSGDWHSTVVGRVGKFESSKDKEIVPPTDGVLSKSLTGHYRGTLTNTNAESNLPERATISLVTTQDTSGTEPIIRISGNTRLYLGDFGSLEYVETKFTDVQFNFFNRYFTAKTADYGLTYKGTISNDGVFTGVVFADGLGEVAAASLKRQ